MSGIKGREGEKENMSGVTCGNVQVCYKHLATAVARQLFDCSNDGTTLFVPVIYLSKESTFN